MQEEKNSLANTPGSMPNRDVRSSDDDGSLSELLELATNEPDEVLLRRYARSVERCGAFEGPLTSAELRWVETNLRVNPLWKSKWRQIQKHSGYGSVSNFARGSMIAACLLSIASFFWVETVHEVRSTMQPEVAAMLQESSTALRSADAVEKPRNPELVVDDAWTLLPTIRFSGLADLLVDLEQRYRTTRDPFKKGELAYRIAGLNEVAGNIAAAIDWYELCHETRTAEYSEQASQALGRLRGRLGN